MKDPQPSKKETGLYAVLIITAMAILGAMLFILRSGSQMIAKITPLADATMEIGMDATVAHLWLMEAAARENQLYFDTAKYHLELADDLAGAMLNGGVVHNTVLVPLDDPTMRRRVEVIRQTLKHLLLVDHDQLPDLMTEHSHKGPSHTHDLLFAGLLEQTAAVEEQLRQVIQREHQNFRQVQLTLMSVCIGFFVLVACMLYRYISARKRYEAKIKRLNLILRAVRNVNHLITREKDRRRLIESTCELLVETRGLHNAWITLLDETGRPTIQAEAGLGSDFEPAVDLLNKGQLLPCCLKSLKHESILVIEDPNRDCPDCPLSEMYSGRSGLASKLQHGGRIYGFMVVSSPRGYAFDEEEHTLFAELAEDIGLSLHLLNMEAEQARAEQAVRESEERYRTLAANIPGCDIFLFDKDLRYLVAEGSEMKSNGLDRDFYEGRTLQETWEKHVRDTIEPLYRSALSGAPASKEYRCCGQYYSLSTVPVYNGGKQVVGGIALSQNITDRRLAEKALRLARFSIDYGADSVFWYGPDGRISDTNPAATDLMGYTREEILTMHVWDALPAFPPEEFARQWQANKRCGAVTTETEMVTKDGRTFLAEVQINYVEFEGYEYNCAFVRDISERKQAEEALKRSESILRHTFEAIPDLISVHNADLKVVLSNWHDREGALKRYHDGWSGRHAACTDSNSRCNPCYARKVFESARPLQLEKTYQDDGSTHEINAYPVFNDAGEVTMVTEHIRDITERKRAEKLQSALFRISEATNLTTNLEELLKTIHEILGTLIDTTNFYVALYDSGKEQYTFPYCIDQHDGVDFPPDQLKKSLTDLVRKTGNPLLVDEKKHREMELSGTIKLVGQPSQVWLGVPLTTAHGVIGVVVVQSYTDPNLYTESDMDLMVFVSGHITMAIERKLAEEALRESEERLRAMYEQASVGVALLSVEGRWLTVNERLCEIVGYSRDDLLQMGCADITHPDDLESSPCFLDQTSASDNHRRTCEKRYIRKDGNIVWGNVSVAMVHDPANAENYLVAVIQDITERKSAEEMVVKYTNQLVVANQELELKQDELEEFIYTVSHDLKSPIVSISGFAGLLNEKLSGTIDDTSSRHLNRILANVQVMESLIGDLLELSRIGRTDEPTVFIDFEGLVDDVFESLSVTIENRSVTLRKASTLPHCQGRHERIRQLVTNLLDNAIKYMPDGREGLVEVGFDDQATHSGTPCPAYYVRDNGNGIPEEFQDRIFGMFQRAHSSANRADGSGVGLAIVKRIVQKHGGRIWLDSPTGQGATFYFSLPNDISNEHTRANDAGKQIPVEYMSSD